MVFMALTRIFFIFVSLCEVVCVRGGRPQEKGKPTKPSPPGEGNTEQWEVLDVPAFHEWEAQDGFGCQYGICGWGNGEFQFYHPDPFRHGLLQAGSNSGGQSLTVTGRLNSSLIKEAVGTCEAWCRDTTKASEDVADCESRCENGEIVSARIRSKGIFSFAPNASVRTNHSTGYEGKSYASFSVRMKVRVEDGTGLWPAVWMLPDTVDEFSSGTGVYGRWPYSGEIDVFESANNMRRQWSTIHFAADSSGTPTDMGKSSSFDTNMHTVEFIWNPDSMVWFKDGREVQTLSGWNAYTPAPSSPSAPFDQPFHLLINLAFGGGHTGQTDPATVEKTLSTKGGQASFHIQDFQVWGLPL